jgi:hypothetical protein
VQLAAGAPYSGKDAALLPQEQPGARVRPGGKAGAAFLQVEDPPLGVRMRSCLW